MEHLPLGSKGWIKSEHERIASSSPSGLENYHIFLQRLAKTLSLYVNAWRKAILNCNYTKKNRKYPILPVTIDTENSVPYLSKGTFVENFPLLAFASAFRCPSISRFRFIR